MQEGMKQGMIILTKHAGLRLNAAWSSQECSRSAGIGQALLSQLQQAQA